LGNKNQGKTGKGNKFSRIRIKSRNKGKGPRKNLKAGSNKKSSVDESCGSVAHLESSALRLPPQLSKKKYSTRERTQKKTQKRGASRCPEGDSNGIQGRKKTRFERGMKHSKEKETKEGLPETKDIGAIDEKTKNNAKIVRGIRERGHRKKKEVGQ